MQWHLHFITETQQSIVLDKYYYSEIFDHCNWPIRRKYSREPCNNSTHTASKLIDMNCLYLLRLIITRVWRCLPVSGRQSWWGWERDTSERVWGKGPQLHIARPAYRTLNLSLRENKNDWVSSCGTGCFHYNGIMSTNLILSEYE